MIHTVAVLQPIARYIIFGLTETRWRAATWSPTAYFLPLAMLAILFMPERAKRHGAWFLVSLGVLAVVLLGLFEALPRYTQPGLLGFTAPTLFFLRCSGRRRASLLAAARAKRQSSPCSR